MKKSVGFEELLVAIDFAGRLQGDNMIAGADPQSFAPEWARSIEEMTVVYASNIDQLGKSVAVAILNGSAFAGEGDHEIVIGAAGGEDIDAAHSQVRAVTLYDMGIKVEPGGDYRVYFEETGDTVDEGVCAVELVFSSKPPRKQKRWRFSGIETAVVNTNVQGQNLNQANAVVSSEGSTLIDSVITAGAGDGAALGCHAIYALLSVGVIEDQEILCAGYGGELVTAGGGNNPPNQRINADIQCKPKEGVYVQFRGVGEAGTMVGGISLGFAV